MKKDLTFAFLLAALMDSISDVIYFKDKKSRFMMVNKAFVKKFGFKTHNEVLGKTDFDLFAEQHAQQAFEDEQNIIKTGSSLEGIEEKETWPDGKTTWVSTTKVPLRNKDGKTIGTFGISRDITSHKEAEIRAASYFDEICQIKDEMENDLRMAGELQRAFFPSTYPVFPKNATPEGSCISFSFHHSPCDIVSGDFCAVTPISNTKAGIFLCDVMGHGVRAALVTGYIRAIVQDLSEHETNPGHFLAHMNARLMPLLHLDDMFLYVTASYLIIDVQTGILKGSLAGHPMPIHSHATPEKKAEWLFDPEKNYGPALAIDKNANFPVIEKQLHPDDRILIYSDGAYEVFNEDGEEFGKKRLLEVVQQAHTASLSEIFMDIINREKAFSGNGKLNDDVCMIGFHLHDLLPK